MHEIGIASSILEASQAEALRRPGSVLTCIGVRVGALSGVNVDALRFAFDALTIGTTLESIGFEIEDCPRRERCLACGHEFACELYSRCCPECGAQDAVLIGGDELDLAYVEVEEA